MKAQTQTLVNIAVVFILGVVVGSFIPKSINSKKTDEVYAIYDGEKIKASDVNSTIQGDLTQLEKSIYEVKRRATEYYIKNKINTEAEKDNKLLEMENFEITPEELSAFLKERNLDSKKLSKAQMNDIVATIKLEKRKQFARKNSEGKIAKSPIQWKIPMPSEPLFALKKATLPTLGDKSSAVEIFYIGNFHCPNCKDAEQRLNQLKEKYKDQIKVNYRFSLQEPDNSIVRAAAEATYCANDQDKFWIYRDHLAQVDNLQETQTLISSADSLNLNVEDFKKCLTGRKYKSVLEKEIQEITDLKIDLVPSFVIGGRLRIATLSVEELSLLIDQEL